MVRIRVIHASRLLLTAALILLTAALILLLTRSVRATTAAPPAMTAMSGCFTIDTPGEIFPVSERVSAALSFLMPPKMKISLDTSAVIPPPNRGRILIYHTHNHEAYAQTADDPYAETDAFRTDDPAHSVVRVGEELASLLCQKGFDVTHDTADHDYAPMDAAYERSKATLLSYAGETFDAVIDIHRDSWNSGLTECAMINGQRIAPLLLLVGKGSDSESVPDYDANLKLACRVTDALNGISDDLCRTVMVKTGCYNQNVFTPSLLIEVGHTRSTLKEALNAMPYLADALSTALPQKQKSGESDSPDP